MVFPEEEPELQRCMRRLFTDKLARFFSLDKQDTMVLMFV